MKLLTKRHAPLAHLEIQPLRAEFDDGQVQPFIELLGHNLLPTERLAGENGHAPHGELGAVVDVARRAAAVEVGHQHRPIQGLNRKGTRALAHAPVDQPRDRPGQRPEPTSSKPQEFAPVARQPDPLRAFRKPECKVDSVKRQPGLGPRLLPRPTCPPLTLPRH